MDWFGLFCALMIGGVVFATVVGIAEDWVRNDERRSKN